MKHPGSDIPSLPPGVTLSTLENGLTIIVCEDHSSPVVSAQAWCMSGSVHEGKWLGAGLSHLLEHMLFKGTASRPGSRIDQEVQDAGGYMNAYTSFDRTVYHIDIPTTGSRVAIDILCDIMQHATLPAEELAKEQNVIRREMDMNVDDPGRRSSRRLFESAYTRSPYRFTVIGYPDLFNEIKPADVFGYYHEKYAPNNVFFVVAGDIDSDGVLGQIRTAYEKNKGRPLVSFVLPAEPRQVAPREVIEEGSVELGHVHMAWHIPELRHPDVPVLDVLAALLGHGRSSRLYRSVREKQGVAHHVDAWTYNPGDPGLFGMSAMVDGDKFGPAREAMLAEIERMKTGPVASDELDKTVRQFISGTLSARKTMQGQAQDLGSSWMAANDLSFSERYLDAVKRVTAEDLQRVARQYLSQKNRTLFALLPRGTRPKSRTGATQSARQAIQKVDFPNGLRLLVMEDRRLPFVEFRAVFKGGVLAETECNNGATQVMAKMLLKGTATRSAEDIAIQIESLGGSLDTYGGNNSFGSNAEVMSGDWRTVFGIFAEVLLHPAFPAAVLEREREVQLANVRAQKDHLLKCALNAARRGLFGKTGYGLDPLGSEESLRALQAADLQAFHRQFAVPNNCVLAIFGDISAQEVTAAVAQTFQNWMGGPVEISGSASNISNHPSSRLEEFRDKQQAVIVTGFPGTTLHHPDRYALELIRETCSDLGSRLFLRVRETLGLAYYVGAQNFPGVAPGYFCFYAGTQPDKVALVEQELLHEAKLLREEGLSEAELNRAKAKILGQKTIAQQDLGTLATTTALDELYGLGYDHSKIEDREYQAVTLQDIKRVAERYLNPKDMVVATIVPGKGKTSG